jgi:hypothetical protein
VFAPIESGKAILFIALAFEMTCIVGVSALIDTDTPEEDVTFHSALTVKFAKISPKIVNIDPGLNLTNVLEIDT